MTRASDGVWSVTTEPLEANGHLYWFNLDGLAVADPINPVIKMRQRTSASLVEVPAASPAPWELRDVPHGTGPLLYGVAGKSPVRQNVKRRLREGTRDCVSSP